METLGNNEPMAPKVLKTEEDYERALAAIAELMEKQPEEGSADLERLELLSLVIRDYESKHYVVESPDPIEAILFRMDQESLTPRDLIPYLGSRSRVSEILSGKRPLSVAMIRALHQGLGIPADVLVKEPQSLDDTTKVDWMRFPYKTMWERGWISKVPKSRIDAERLMTDWLGTDRAWSSLAVLYRQRSHVRSTRRIDDYALAAWTARVSMRALESPPDVDFSTDCLTPEFLKEVARVSVFQQGPRLVRELLRTRGISMVVEPHLPGTHLDGAAILDKTGLPLIALTIRHDRLDNFWFCLMHELVHLAKHLKPGSGFFDDLDAAASSDVIEEEADSLAGEALIPSEVWRTSPASKLRSPEAVTHLARRLGIHPAIVAGRIRHNSNQYRILATLVGSGEVRNCFPEVEWPR